MKSTKLLIITLLISIFALSGCKESNREKSAQEQDDVLTRARNAVPTVKMNNFLVRQYIAEYMKRMDMPDKTFYIYILSNTGQYIGYYVGKSKPISSCLLMTTPDNIYGRNSSGKAVVSAPTLDGVFQPNGSCDTKFFLEANTNGLVELSGNGLNTMSTDFPLNLDVQRLTQSQSTTPP